MIGEPHCILDRFGAVVVRDRRPLDEHDRKAEAACGSDFAIGGRAPGVLADDHIDPVGAQQGDLVFDGEGAAGEQVFDIEGGERRIDGIDAAHEIMMLRGGIEGLRLLPADGEKDAAWRFTKGDYRIGNRGDAHPAVARNLFPAESLEPQQRNAGGGAGCTGIGGNLLGEGMRGVDEKIDRMRSKIGGKPFHTAETARADRHRLRGGIERAAGERQRDGKIRASAKPTGQIARFRRAAKNEDASLVHA